jgi:plasmid maintenance system antidote protein VapI
MHVSHPWKYIGRELEARNWKQKEFADVIWISAPALNAIIKWEKNLTASLSVRIWEAFWTSAEVRMRLQIRYSIEQANNYERERISDVHKKLKKYWLKDLSLLSDEDFVKEFWLEKKNKTKKFSPEPVLVW